MTFYRTRAATVTIISVLAISVVVSGCGSGSSTAAGTHGSSGSGPTITKVTLIKKGDANCRQTDATQKKRLVSWEKQHPKESLIETSVQERALVWAAIPPLASEIEGIAALGLPAGEEGGVEAIVSGWRGALKALEQKPFLLMESDEGPFTAPDKLAKAYGFKNCAKAL